MEKSCETCEYKTYDMDGLYCEHPTSLEISGGFGRSLNAMTLERLCFHGNDNEKGTFELWEIKTGLTDAEKTTASIKALIKND